MSAAEEDLADVNAALRSLLVEAHRSRSLASPTSAATATAAVSVHDEAELRVKMEYLGEKRSVLVRRPLSYTSLVAKIRQMYGRELAIYYTVHNSEIIVPMRSQEELEKALSLLASSSHMRSLRLLLSKHSSSQSESSAVAKKEDSGRFSPPPGTFLPSSAARRKLSSHGPHSQTSSKRSEGEFIPEDCFIHEVPYASSASSRASSRLSADGGCNQCSLGSLRSGFRRGGGGAGPSHRGGGGSWGRRGQQSSRASSSSSSGLVPDLGGLPRQPAPAGDSPLSPQAPSNWRQGRCLGSGAYGSVYLCYDADTSKELAVKRVLLNQAPHNRHSLRKETAALENEIRLLKNLCHDRIVAYLGFHRDEESLCIFMEYMAGGSVKDEIRTYGPLQESVVRKYTYQILEGLNYLHHYEIAHRDIKCANILRDGGGNVKIGDFGSGKRLQTICSQSAALTFIGTPYYMAPEVISGRGYGRKADIWSLGCSLVEMLSGQPPWRELEPMAAILRIALESPDLRSLLPPSLAPDLASLLRSLFQREPNLRPTASQLLQSTALAQS